MSRESIFVLDDSSLEAKVLQHELKTSYDITTIRMPKYEDLETWKNDFEYHLKDVIAKMTGIIRIFLPYSFEDYQTKDIRTAFMEIQRKYPNVRVIPWYEQASKDSIKNRAANYGIMATTEEEKGPAIAIDWPEKEDIASDIVKTSKEHLEARKQNRKKKKFEFD